MSNQKFRYLNELIAEKLEIKTKSGFKRIYHKKKRLTLQISLRTKKKEV